MGLQLGDTLPDEEEVWLWLGLREPLDVPVWLVEELAERLGYCVLLSVCDKDALCDCDGDVDPLDVLDWLADAEAELLGVPLADADTPWLSVCVGDCVTLDVRPCEELLLGVDDSLGLVLALAVGSCELEALSLPVPDSLDVALPLGVTDEEEVGLMLGVEVLLGDPL